MFDIIELHHRLMERQNENNSPIRTESYSYIKARVAEIEREDDEDRRRFLQTGTMPSSGGSVAIFQ